MRMSVTAKAFILATACMCVPAAGARAQQVGSVLGTLPDPSSAQQIPARDRRPRPRTGTGVIRGRVVDGSTSQPLAHARVRISGMGTNVTMLTDASGSFAFSSLPGGRYTLMAMKPSYLQGSLPAITSSLRSIPGLLLADGQTLENLTLPLYHGGVISGHLVDAYGDPVEGVNVQVVRAPGSRSSRSFVMTGSVNDAGEFRISHLEAGAYLLFAMPNGGRSEGDPDVTANVATYYPGVLSPEQAQPIVVERGQTLSGLDFQILEQPVTTVMGIVIDGSGQAAQGGNVSAQTRFSTGTGGGFFGRGSAQVHQDGTFELKLPPGDYQLSAFARLRDEAANSQPIVGRVATQHVGVVRVTVGGEPVTNVVIRAGGGGTISGKVVFDGDSPPVDPKQISVYAHAQRPIGPQALSFGGPDECRTTKQGAVSPDLTFRIEDVHGTCVLDVSLDAGRWRAKSAIYRGADLFDRPVEIDLNQHVRDVTVTISDRRTELSADVTNDQGEASLDYVLLAFSADKARWPLQRYTAFFTRSSGAPSASSPTRTLTAIIGTATILAPASGAVVPPSGIGSGVGSTLMSRAGVISTLPAGDYYVVAIDDATYEDIRDPAYLDQLVPKATRVTLREGEPQTVQLRRIKSPVTAQ